MTAAGASASNNKTGGRDLNDVVMDDPVNASAAVKAAMAKAQTITATKGLTTGARSPRKSRSTKTTSTAEGVSPAAEIDNEDAGVERLTPSEWKVLEACAALDENDADNGKRLLAWFGDRILHVNESGWYGWTGTHWDIETGRHAVERMAHQVVPMIKREAALIAASPDERTLLDEAQRLKVEFPSARSRSEAASAAIKLGADIGKALAGRRQGRFQFAVKSGDRQRTKAMIDQAEPHRSQLPKVMDADDLALNTATGTLRFSRELDLECPDPEVRRYKVTRTLSAHDPSDHITKVTAASYDSSAAAPQFRRDLVRFMPDDETREFLQVFIGYCALGVTGEQVYAFLYGDGQNWKSAFLQAVGRALGSYTKPMNYASVSGNSTPSGDKPSPDWARLPGVRLLTIEEVPRREPLKEELIKMITSGSDMPVRHLNKGLFDMPPKFTAIMTSNAEPNITGADHGIWRRTLIVHWDVIVPEAERLPFDQVMAMYEAERDGILSWIVEGIEKYLATGLKPYITDAMRAFSDSVRRDRDAVGAYVEDCVAHVDEAWVTSRMLYRGFVRWCAANGVDPVPSETSFGLKIKRVPVAGVPMEKRKRSVEGVKRFVDIALHLPPETAMGTDSE